MITKKNESIKTLVENLVKKEIRKQTLLKEENEIPILDSKLKKKLKNIFETVDTGADSISFKKDGSVIVKRGYFYSGGWDQNKLAEKVKSAFKQENVEIEILKKENDWKPWPKDSNFVVTFKITKY